MRRTSLGSIPCKICASISKYYVSLASYSLLYICLGVPKDQLDCVSIYRSYTKRNIQSNLKMTIHFKKPLNNVYLKIMFRDR